MSRGRFVPEEEHLYVEMDRSQSTNMSFETKLLDIACMKSAMSK